MQRNFALPILVIFLFVALFGLTLLLSHSGHHEGCPLMSAQAVMCESSIVEHASMWNSMFASIITSLTLLIAITFLFRNEDGLIRAHERIRFRGTTQFPRPTLFQELFSRGILNRKEPHVFS